MNLSSHGKVEKTSSQGLLVVMGDLNDMVGTDNRNVIGRHGYSNLNDNGERLVELGGMNDLVIGGFEFPYKDIHKI